MATSVDVVRGHRHLVRAAGHRPGPSGLLTAGVVLAVGDTAGVAGGTLAVAGARYALPCTAVTVALAGAAGLYRPRLTMSVLDDLPRLLLVCGLAVAFNVTTLPWWAWGLSAGRPRTVPGPAAVLGAATAALVAVRVAAYAGLRRARCHGYRRRTLVVGTGDPAVRLTRTLRAHPEFGLEPIGCVFAGTSAAAGPGTGVARDAVVTPDAVVVPPPVGLLRDLPELVADHGARCVVFALSTAENRDVDPVAVLRAWGTRQCQVYVVPQMYEMYPVASGVEMIRGIPLIAPASGPSGRLGRVGKRVVDVVLSGSALVLLSPLLAACMVAVYLENGPGVLFRQVRIGRGGKPFTLLKFRSMRPADQAEADTAWSIAGDDRVGPVGRILRKTSLDELPQLINILRGDMSLVGPRPERPYFVNEFSSRYAGYGHRHRMDAGLTGLAQVNGLRGDTSIDERVLLDNHYIEHWSLWLDVKIALRTAAVLFKGDQ